MKAVELEMTVQELIRSSAEEVGIDLHASSHLATRYAMERAAYLSTLVGQTGYAKAVRAERDNVALTIGIAAAAQASAAEQRMLGVLQAVLSLAAKLLVAL